MYYGYNDDEITVNESTATVNNVEEYDLDNLMESVISSYINDYTIFEATLKRDFLEVRGVLTEEAEGNLLKTLWEKIVGVFTRIKEAITKAIESLCAKIDEIKTSRCQKIVKKYDSLYSRENGELDELSIDNFYPWKEDVHVEFTFAFMYSDDKLKELYMSIPPECDIFISHDAADINNLGLVPPNIWHPKNSVNAGNKILTEFIKKLKPKYYFCGHIHEGNHQVTKIDGTTMANVSLLNDSYKMVYEPLYLDI